METSSSGVVRLSKGVLQVLAEFRSSDTPPSGRGATRQDRSTGSTHPRPSGSSPQPRSTASALRRLFLAWLAALLCVLVGVGMGWFVYQELPPTYESRAAVLVLPTSPGGDATRAGQEVQIETEAELARSALVASLASEQLTGRLSEQQLLADSSVNVPSNSQVLELTFRAGSGELARDGATALATAYLERRGDDASQQTSRTVAALEAQAADLNTRLDELADSPGAQAEPGSPARADAESQRSLLLDQLSDINSRLVPLRTSGGFGGEIITQAALPQAPVSPSLLLTVGAGAVLGLFVGTWILLMRGQGRRSVTRLPQVQGHAAIPLLGAVSTGLLSGTFSDAERRRMDRLLEGLAPLPDDGPLVIVSTDPEDSAVVVALGLTDSWSRVVRGAALVLSEPSQALAGHPSSGDGPGLADVLRREASLVDVARAVPGTGVFLIPAGTGLTGATLTEPDSLENMWRLVTREYGSTVVLVDLMTDSQMGLRMARSAGQIVLVASADAEAAEMEKWAEELEWWGVHDRLAGVIKTVTARPGDTGVRLDQLRGSTEGDR